MAVKSGVKANIILQNYMLERLLERISLSKHNRKFILKGGMLISAMVGLDTRTTMDMDASIKGIELSNENLLKVFDEIVNTHISDNVTFNIKKIEEIREDEEYSGLRVSIEAIFESVVVPLKIDVSAGDAITPKEIMYSFQLLFEDRKIDILAYNLETVLAEKFETIISRGILNTRARDFYDVYILTKMQSHNISKENFKKALATTAKKRETIIKINDAARILEDINTDNAMASLWKNYTMKFDYANDITFEEIKISLKQLFEMYIN